MIANIVALPRCGKGNSLESQKPYLEEKKIKKSLPPIGGMIIPPHGILGSLSVVTRTKTSLIYIYILKTPK